jgi:transposase-like protein
MEYTLQQVEEHSDNEMEFALWLNDEGFIRTVGTQCSSCGQDTFLVYSTHFKGDQVALRCKNNKCNALYSVSRGSFFQHSHLSLQDQMRLLIHFVNNVSPSVASRLTKISRKTITQRRLVSFHQFVFNRKNNL